jgi:hypothetical protein
MIYLNSLEVSDFNFFNRHNKERHFDQVDQAIHGGHHKHLTAMRRSIETEISIWRFEFDLVVTTLLNSFAKKLKLFIESASHGLLTFFFLHFFIVSVVFLFEI